MPKGSKHAEPAYRHVTASEIPTLTADEGRVLVRVVAGAVGDLAGPIATSGNPFVVHASLKAGARVDLPAGGAAELGGYVMVGAAFIGGDDRRIEAGQLARLTAGDSLEIEAASDSEILLIGGDPLDAPILRHGPFVMNSIDELERAVRDYHAGRMGRIAA
jgi:redox-sensitive bicupin YhaK (pirin superfamily)